MKGSFVGLQLSHNHEKRREKNILAVAVTVMKSDWHANTSVGTFRTEKYIIKIYHKYPADTRIPSKPLDSHLWSSQQGWGSCWSLCAWMLQGFRRMFVYIMSALCMGQFCLPLVCPRATTSNNSCHPTCPHPNTLPHAPTDCVSWPYLGFFMENVGIGNICLQPKQHKEAVVYERCAHFSPWQPHVHVTQYGDFPPNTRKASKSCSLILIQAWAYSLLLSLW